MGWEEHHHLDIGGIPSNNNRMLLTIHLKRYHTIGNCNILMDLNNVELIILLTNIAIGVPPFIVLVKNIPLFIRGTMIIEVCLIQYTTVMLVCSTTLIEQIINAIMILYLICVLTIAYLQYTTVMSGKYYIGLLLMVVMLWFLSSIKIVLNIMVLNREYLIATDKIFAILLVVLFVWIFVIIACYIQSKNRAHSWFTQLYQLSNSYVGMMHNVHHVVADALTDIRVREAVAELELRKLRSEGKTPSVYDNTFGRDSDTIRNIELTNGVPPVSSYIQNN